VARSSKNATLQRTMLDRLQNVVSVANSAVLLKYLRMHRGCWPGSARPSTRLSTESIANFVLAGLATVVTETKNAPRGLTITVVRIHITDDGTRALEDRPRRWAGERLVASGWKTNQKTSSATDCRLARKILLSHLDQPTSTSCILSPSI
jgi:hypothetical protein